MNLNDLHTNDRIVSAVPIFKMIIGAILSIRIKQNQQLKEHITKVPAFLICLEGSAVFENENGVRRNYLLTTLLK
jgi:hypothetical protein